MYLFIRYLYDNRTLARRHVAYVPIANGLLPHRERHQTATGSPCGRRALLRNEAACAGVERAAHTELDLLLDPNLHQLGVHLCGSNTEIDRVSKQTAYTSNTGDTATGRVRGLRVVLCIYITGGTWGVECNHPCRYWHRRTRKMK
eukprot:1192828-Prorocentrum_minimum.AAC.1